VERKNHRTWYKDANPFGNKIHAVQKSRGKSTPLI
ncbi:MAG: antitermination protein, partial [Citrobacter sp.]